MKKIKLLTSLSSLAIIGASVPIVATSCSNSSDYTVSGLNWNNAPTVGVTSTPNQWYITKGNDFIASYDNCDNVKELKINDKTSAELGFTFNETLQKGFITPTKKGAYTLALDFTLDNGTKFTASTTVVVNTNYPWTVSQKDNCTATEQGKKVVITDITKDATLNVTMDSIPSGANYVVNATKFGDETKTYNITHDNGVLTIPANTFTKADTNTMIECTVTVKNNRSIIGETLYLNISTTSGEMTKDNGLVTFGTIQEIAQFALANQFAVEETIDPINIDNTEELSTFINKYVSAGMVAEGTLIYILSSFGPLLNPVGLNEEEEEEEEATIALNDAILNWTTSGNVLSLSSKFVIDYYGSATITIVLKGTVIKDSENKKVHYDLNEFMDFGGSPSNDFYYNATGPAFIESGNEYLTNLVFFDEFNSGSFRLPLPTQAFNNKKGLTIINSKNMGFKTFKSEEEIASYFANANYPVSSEFEELSISKGAPAKGVSALLTSDNINLGILADGLYYEIMEALNDLKEKQTGYSLSKATIEWGYTWSNISIDGIAFEYTLNAVGPDNAKLIANARTVIAVSEEGQITNLYKTVNPWSNDNGGFTANPVPLFTISDESNDIKSIEGVKVDQTAEKDQFYKITLTNSDSITRYLYIPLNDYTVDGTLKLTLID